MALSEPLHWLRLLIAVVLTHVCFLGFLSSGSHTRNAWVWFTITPIRYHLPHSMANEVGPVAANLSLNSTRFIVWKRILDRHRALRGMPGDFCGEVPHTATPGSTSDCDRLDAELTGLHCFEAQDPATRQRCCFLSMCNIFQPELADIQRVIPDAPPLCASSNASRLGVRNRTDRNCSSWRDRPKYFHESQLSAHLDARWGRRVLAPAERRRVMGDLFGAWSAFTHQRGLLSWLFAGSLIGWFFNKEMLPWDDDLDVQVLASHLLSPKHFLRHNSTVYQGRYLFQVNPHSARRHRDRNNTIDARFIDKLTGVFVDVIAISYSPEAQVLRCKQQEAFAPAELFPLRRSTFMGAAAWVPHDPAAALIRKYGPSVVLRRQPQHRMTHCHSGPCATYHFDPTTAKWVDFKSGGEEVYPDSPPA